MVVVPWEARPAGQKAPPNFNVEHEERREKASQFARRLRHQELTAEDLMCGSGKGPNKDGESGGDYGSTAMPLKW